MAGAGARLFPGNSKLTSTQVNTYLMDQTIMRFATTAARDAAFGGVGEPTLAEGMTCYIDADNSIYTYDGSNWVKMISASQPPGLVKIRSVNLSGTAVDIESCFTDEFENYRIVVSNLSNSVGAVYLRFQMLSGSTPASGASTYKSQRLLATGTQIFADSFNDVSAPIATFGNYANGASIELYSPKLARPTIAFSNSNYDQNTGVAIIETFAATHQVSTAYDGIRLISTSANFATGTATVYGYR